MRKYNYKISKRANESLNKRATIVLFQKILLVVAAFFIISLILLLGSSMNVFANAKKETAPYHKYYKSIRIEEGDTLWEIADEHIANVEIDKRAYIKEICTLNDICEDTIYAGDYIIVTYYSQDIK